MTCTPCNGSSLISSYEVCATCKGIGHDGTETFVAQKPKGKTSIFKSKKK